MTTKKNGQDSSVQENNNKNTEITVFQNTYFTKSVFKMKNTSKKIMDLTVCFANNN